MANYTSQPIQVTQPASNVNLPLTNQVLAMRQQKYDANKEKINQTVSTFTNLDIMRPQDKEYLANRISTITNTVNSSGDRDLSQGAIADDILQTVSGVANDPIVQNAIINTAKYKQFETQTQQIREKKPELYSDTNYSYALANAGVEQYLAGQTNSIGDLKYTNYIDVTTTALKKIKELKDLRGKQVIETPDPQNEGRMIKRSIDGLTDQEIFEYIPNILSPEESKQLDINGWAKYGGNLQVAQKNFNSYRTELFSNIDENIENYTAVLNSSTATTQQKKSAQSAIDAYKRQKEQTDAQLSGVNINNPASIGSFLERNSWLQGIATMAKAGESVEISKDEYYFAKAGLELDIAKEEREKQMFGVDYEQKLLNIAKTQRELGVDVQGNPIINPGAVTVSAKEAGIIEEINPYQNQLKDFKLVTDEMKGLITEAVNSDRTPDDAKEHYIAEMRKRGYDATGVVIAGKEKIAAQNPPSLAMKQAFDASHLANIHGDVAKRLAGVEVKRNSLASEVGKNKVDGLVTAFKENGDKYIQRFKDLLSEVDIDRGHRVQSDTSKLELSKIWTEVNNFINENGGIDNLKKAIQTDKVKLSKFAQLQDKLENKPQSIAGRTERVLSNINPLVPLVESRFIGNINEDAQKISNQRLREQTQRGESAFFNTAQVATIGDKTTREKIVNMLPQTSDTQIFNPDNPISFEKTPEGDIRVSQNKGYTTGKSQTMLRDAEIIISSKDAAFKELTRYIDVTDRGRGLDAARTSIKVRPTIDTEYIDNTNKIVLNKVDSYINTLSPTVQKSFTANPVWYLTKNRTNEAYKAALKGIVTEENINRLTEALSSNINKLTPEMMPFDGNWALKVTTDKGKTIYNGDTGIKYLEDDWAYLVKTYPQVIASEAVLRYLKENPEEINSLINNLQQ